MALPGQQNTINGTNGDDNIVGTALDDLIRGAGGNDNIDSIDGNDYLEGGLGNDILLGGAGDDWLIGGVGNDTYTGGTGADQFRFYGYAITGAGTATPGNDIDKVTDFSFAESDVLVLANFSAGTFEGTDINGALDLVDTGEGAGSGANVRSIEGLVDLVQSSDAVTASRLGNTNTLVLQITDAGGAIQTINLDNLWDDYSAFFNHAPVALADYNGIGAKCTLSVNASKGVLKNDSDPDGDSLVVAEVNGSAANVGKSIAGTYGTLKLNADGSYSYVANDKATKIPDKQVAQDIFTYTVSDGQGGFTTTTLTITVADKGESYKRGTDGDDCMFNLFGNAILDGGNGNDTLIGGLCNDSLIGGAGNDWLVGAFGKDTFVFNPGSGNDVIVDFGLGDDTIQFSKSIFQNFSQVLAATTVQGNTLVIDLGNGDSVTLLFHNSLNDLKASDFIFV